MKNPLLVATIAALTLAATASGATDPKQMVLRLQDMPTGFTVKSATYETIQRVAGSGGVTLAQFRAWGYLTGYEAQFNLADPSLVDVATSPLDVSSSISVYRSTTGAKASFASSAAQCSRPPLTRLAAGARIGDDVRLCTYATTSNGVDVRAYIVVWRHGALKASVLVVSTAAAASASQAVALAQAQDGRMSG